eukprot:CAMPEP_0171624180 /NCGR_PEP_ID=MMETSP0990-20121206/18451_1 /TAXON_ID=483369 /ORGANISM="non described non described, Strain CCMP2098" /LENGTH=255 /DNA_ID=CAMNT_0012190651 /DNA_START=46 /DNA_END=813 /DNA_ORIENTATION=-
MAASTDRSRILDMQSMGLSPDDLNPSGPLSSRRALARAQSAQIMAKKFIQRDRIKEQLKSEEMRLSTQKKMEQKRQEHKWQRKMASSPFTVNLVADSERLEEEHTVRMEDEIRRRALVESKTRAAKQDIILRALQEESDLEALRREKRAIMEEERRLKALLDLEKTNGHGKADRMAAVRAEKMRHSTKADYRRSQNLASIEDLRTRELDLLVFKHDLPEPTPSGSWGNREESRGSGGMGGTASSSEVYGEGFATS